MKKLYEVIATYYVVADSESQAQSIEPDIVACDVQVIEVNDANNILTGWKNAIPFHSISVRTCKEILEVNDVLERDAV